MKKYLIITLGLALISTSTFAAVAAEKKAGSLELKTNTDKISYSLGYQIGGDFKRQKVDINSDAILLGIGDAISDQEPLLTAQEMTSLLVSLKEKVVAVQRQVYVKNSKKFLDSNAKKEGVMGLPSGAQYRILKEGSGTSPLLEDTVDVHFIMTNTDGDSLASTYGETAPRSYRVQKMLPGLRNALLKMKPGAKWEVFVPPAARGEKMESSGVLVYEIELIAIHPAAVTGG